MWLAACGVDTVTTANTVVGRVLDPSGGPVVGLTVESLEAKERTDEAGAFAVVTKAPNQLVHFTHQGLWYRRKVAQTDFGEVLNLALPATRSARLACPNTACNLSLTWDLGAQFTAQVRHSCTPGGAVELPAAPTTDPRVQCRVGRGTAGRSLSLQIQERDGTLALVEEAARLEIELRATAGALPPECDVRVGNAAARPVPRMRGARLYSVIDPGDTVVRAVCGSRPALPVARTTADRGPAQVEWSPTGPRLDLSARAPWAVEAVWVSEGAGWSLPLSLQDGAAALPPLPQGSYRLLVRGEGASLPVAMSPPEGSVPGVLMTAAKAGELVGRLVLDAPLASGDVPIK